MRARHVLEYGALLAFAAVCRALPRPLALAAGAAVGQLGWWLRLRRRLVLGNLAIALPHLDARDRRRLAARAARNFGRTVVEFVRFAGRDRRRVGDLVTFDGLEHLREALAGGQGAIVVTAHLGSWALYVTALAAAGIPSALLVGRQHNAHVDRFILAIPGDAVRFISKGRTAPRGVLQSLREGRAVVMVADQDAGPHGVVAPFLGRPASTLPLPAAVVARHGTPLVLMTGHRGGAGRHRVVVSRLEAGDDVTAAFNRALGEAVRTAPEHYFWYHRRWRDHGARQPRGSSTTAAASAPAAANATPSENEAGR